MSWTAGGGRDGPDPRRPGPRAARALLHGVRVLPRRASRASARRSGSSASTSPGTFAEFVVVPVAQPLSDSPRACPSTQAAAFPLVYQTAWRMLVGRVAVRPGETVLIHGAGGGVGGAALEIALLVRSPRPRHDLGSGEGRAAVRRPGPSSSSTTRRRTSLEVDPGAHRQARRRRRRGHGRGGHLDDLAEGGGEGRADRHLRRDVRTQSEGGDPPDLLETPLDPRLDDGERPGVPRPLCRGRGRPPPPAHRPRLSAVGGSGGLPAHGRGQGSTARSSSCPTGSRGTGRTETRHPFLGYNRPVLSDVARRFSPANEP